MAWRMGAAIRFVSAIVSPIFRWFIFGQREGFVTRKMQFAGLVFFARIKTFRLFIIHAFAAAEPADVVDDMYRFVTGVRRWWLMPLTRVTTTD
jgi:hypothetical protein